MANLFRSIYSCFNLSKRIYIILVVQIFFYRHTQIMFKQSGQIPAYTYIDKYIHGKKVQNINHVKYSIFFKEFCSLLQF